MAPETIAHPFHDIEVEPVEGTEGRAPGALVKILAQDGRRFTYLVRADLTREAVAFVRRMIDMGSVSDLVIEEKDGGFHATESAEPLKKHG